MDDLFDITKETALVSEIKDILDELNIISSVMRHQAAVIEPFMVQMLHQPLNMKDDSTRLRNYVEELQTTARSTYAAVSAVVMRKVSSCGKLIIIIAARFTGSEAEAS